MKAELRKGLLAMLIAPAFGLAISANATPPDQSPQRVAQAGGTTAQQEAAPLEQDRQQQLVSPNVRASELIGSDVRDPQGEDLGEIEDLILDSQSDRVHYAVLSFGGFLGLGEKLFAYPVQAFMASMTSDEIVLNIDRERLANAPGFDRDRWPDWGRDSYGREVDDYFQHRSDDKTAGAPTLIRASELIGTNLEDADGKNVGEIEDVVVNMGDGSVSFVVLAFDRGWGADDRLHPVPLSSLTFSGAANERILFTTPAAEFDTGRGFAADAWPNLNDPAYRTDAGMEVRRQGMTEEVPAGTTHEGGMPGTATGTPGTGRPGGPPADGSSR